MALVLQFRDRWIDSAELLPLLVQYQLLPQLLREMTIDHAIATVPLTEAERSQAQAEFDAKYQLKGDADRQTWMQQQGLSPIQFEEIRTRSYRIEKFKVMTWSNRLEAIFLTQKPERDQVTYSLLRTSNPELAQELYFRIKAGEQSFAQLARDYSQGPEAETEGVVGPVPMSQPHPVLAEKLRHSQPGQLLPPTQIGEWYVLLRLDEIVPAKLDAAMRQNLLDDLFDSWVTEQLATVSAPALPTPSRVPA